MKRIADVYPIELRARGVSPICVTLVDVPRVRAQRVEARCIDLGHACGNVLHRHHEVGFVGLPHGLNRNSNLNVISRISNVLGKLFHLGLSM